MDSVEAKPIDEEKVWIVGKGMMIYLGHLTDAQIRDVKNMSDEARKNFVNKYIAQYPDACKYTAGYCKDVKKHVTEVECGRCALNQGYDKLAQWDLCRSHNLSGTGGQNEAKKEE